MNKTSKVPGGNELINAHELLHDHLGLTFGARVADLGCGGAGYFVLQAGQLIGNSGVVYAVDILKNVLGNVQTRAKILGIDNIKTIWSNLEKYQATKINNNTVDFTLLINVLFQNNNHLNILKEATRITRIGGKILIVDWNEGRFQIGPKPEDKVSIEKIMAITQTLNLRLEKQFNAGKFHYGLVFVKQ